MQEEFAFLFGSVLIFLIKFIGPSHCKRTVAVTEKRPKGKMHAGPGVLCRAPPN